MWSQALCDGFDGLALFKVILTSAVMVYVHVGAVLGNPDGVPPEEMQSVSEPR